MNISIRVSVRVIARAAVALLVSLVSFASPTIAVSAERQEVTIANDSMTRVNISGSFDIIEPGAVSQFTRQIYTVPRGKRLLIEYSSIEMDANIDNPGDTDFQVYTYLRSTGRQGARFLLGTLTQGPNTSRGPPYFYLAEPTPIFVQQLNPISLNFDSKHSGVKFTLARVTYAFSCRLVDIR